MHKTRHTYTHTHTRPGNRMSHPEIPLILFGAIHEVWFQGVSAKHPIVPKILFHTFGSLEWPPHCVLSTLPVPMQQGGVSWGQVKTLRPRDREKKNNSWRQNPALATKPNHKPKPSPTSTNIRDCLSRGVSATNEKNWVQRNLFWIREIDFIVCVQAPMPSREPFCTRRRRGTHNMPVFHAFNFGTAVVLPVYLAHQERTKKTDSFFGACSHGHIARSRGRALNCWQFVADFCQFSLAGVAAASLWESQFAADVWKKSQEIAGDCLPVLGAT